uniref:Uncharacterized protein n=1 Tax=Ascaris lumbricoides TaxID=6252 RepID=A0A0M3HVL2_ASCLU
MFFINDVHTQMALLSVSQVYSIEVNCVAKRNCASNLTAAVIAEEWAMLFCRPS